VRIFQKLSTVDIIRQVIEPYSATLKNQVQATLRPREYCVQYRESDFNFVSRLMEEEGIFYFFRHRAGAHEMVICDGPWAHNNELGVKALPFDHNARRRSQGADVTRWRWSRQIQTGKVSLRDHTFELPGKTFEGSETSNLTHAHGKIESYDYPIGLAPTSGEPAELQKLFPEAAATHKRRLDAVQAPHAMAEGSTTSLRLCAGARFKLTGHSVQQQNAEYIVHATHIRVRIAGHESGEHEESSHECDFTAFESKVAYRPPRLTPKPHVAGPQTATVVGPSGQEIYTDKYGRVKVQFHWDRKGQHDAQSSCFMRVAQPAAGKGWGVVMLPRIGQEVVVNFLEGDPDQPLITGSVFNAENMPPYELPDLMSVSSWKTRSFGGSANDFNELRFDDKAGNEHLMLRAQKDRADLVLNDLRAQIGNNEERTVGKNSSLSVGESQDLTVGKNAAHTVGEAMMLTVGKDLQISSGATLGITVAEGFTVDAGSAYSMNAGSDVHLKAGSNFGAEAGTNAHLKGGVNVVIEAGVQLTLKAGASSIVIGPDGVSITGTPMVKVNSGGGAGSGSGAKPVKPTKPKKAVKPTALKDPLQGKHR
jgi:type VI secretion system secreted protein VgrG